MCCWWDGWCRWWVVRAFSLLAAWQGAVFFGFEDADGRGAIDLRARPFPLQRRSMPPSTLTRHAAMKLCEDAAGCRCWPALQATKGRECSPSSALCRTQKRSQEVGAAAEADDDAGWAAREEALRSKAAADEEAAKAQVPRPALPAPRSRRLAHSAAHPSALPLLIKTVMRNRERCGG